MVVGGRDLVAGGTWLAVREGRFVAALLNRRPPAAVSGGDGGDGSDPMRSRGLLCLDAAAAGPGFDQPAAIDPATGDPYPARLDAALRVIDRGRFAPCSLVGLEAGGPSWVVALRPDEEPRATLLEPGWHVITHAEMDRKILPWPAPSMTALCTSSSGTVTRKVRTSMMCQTLTAAGTIIEKMLL